MTLLSLSTTLALLVGFAAKAFAHSEVSCVDWDGKSDCYADTARTGYGWPSHPNYGRSGADYNYERRYAGPLCAPYVNNGTTIGAPSSPMPAPAVAGELKTIVWSCNRHCQKFRPLDGANTNAFLWHSPDDNPGRSLYETTPLVQFNWNNCWNNTYGISAHGSSHKEMLCSGSFIVPESLKTGVHTFVWSWLWNGKWDLMANGIVYLSCFQYNVTGIGGTYPTSKKTPPSVGFTANLTNYMEAPAKLKNSGANGIVYPFLGDTTPVKASKPAALPSSTSRSSKPVSKPQSSTTRPAQATSKVVVTKSASSSKVVTSIVTKSAALPVAIAKPTLSTSSKASSSSVKTSVIASSTKQNPAPTSTKKNHWHSQYWKWRNSQYRKNQKQI